MLIMEIIIENEARMDNITFGESEKYYESMYKDSTKLGTSKMI